ncbi:signal peptide peptidase SppA [Cardinium endosymbiont of Oedothorax gibbosus]|uniref:signal peptide peptidase SppA n=1 Tax=Cardinium endosymbiont of Oedothorax gibbosus TaxID=931101 RepID=UPI002025431F|nr:signal peptide peptidase SppA [Cardinium endosymbiont of Oedothorax gibbosus]CAH2560038.1 Peptidase S49, protease IV family protein [Cardinium endosymbiont of Oedothorax gibbosus]
MSVKRFIKQVLTIAIGFLISLLSLCFIVVFGFLKLTSKDSRQVENNSVVAFNMEGRMVEWVPISLFGSNKGLIDFKVVKKAIHQATKDSRVPAIYLDVSYLDAGWAALEEIREALLAFKKQGKTIIAYGDLYTQKSYYLASVADEIILNPSGFLAFKGFSATVEFYTKLFEHIAIKPIIFRVGDYKSAVEPFCLTKMSEESRQQIKACLQPCYEHFLIKIGASRNIGVTALKGYANNLSAVLPNDALHAHFITRIGYETEAKQLLKEKLKSPSFIGHKEYSASESPPDSVDKIAVFIAEGEIGNGSSRAGHVGAHGLVKTLKVIQEDSSVKALVLRINSPGGSIVASNIIWKAIAEFRSVKPVVASMSNVATSGGYYIAAPCHYIFAQPTTITGSIGVFGILFDPAELMHKIGIHRDVVKTAPSADFLTPRVNCSELESKLMYKMLQESYDGFLCKVSNGRRLDLACVEKLAGGRVYTGLVAKDNGLVDELGGLDAAIAKAVSLAKLTQKYRICYLPRPKTKFQQLLSYTTNDVKIELLDALVQEYPIMSHYHTLSILHSVQAMLPYKIHID